MALGSRGAWQALAARFARAAPLPQLGVSFRQMSSGSVPRENWIYALLFAGAAAGGSIFYAYRKVVSDNARYQERIAQLQQSNTGEWKPKPWPPPSLESHETETEEVTDTSEEAKDAAEEETEGEIAGESQVQSEEHAESAESESEKEGESPAEEATSGVPGGEQDAPANSEATQDQG